MPRSYFIAGTDTEIGKTTIACALLHLARKQGLSTLAAKPIASGCFMSPAGLRNTDALSLQAECSLPITYEQLNPFAFEPAIAPHIAAAQIHVELKASQLVETVQTITAQKADFTLVEGAGGWYVPINQNERLSDVVQTLALPVILVVGIRLGCINHALLSFEAINQAGLTVAGWVANHITPHTESALENVNYLEHALPIPCLGRVPYIPNSSAATFSTYLNLPTSGL